MILTLYKIFIPNAITSAGHHFHSLLFNRMHGPLYTAFFFFFFQPLKTVSLGLIERRPCEQNGNNVLKALIVSEMLISSLNQ